MINDHNNQHSNTYPFHGNRSDHLEEKKFFKICLDRRQSTDTIETLPKAQRTRGLSYAKFKQVQTQILIKLESRPSTYLKISTKH